MKKRRTHSPFLVFVILLTLCVAALYWYMQYTVGISAERVATARSLVSAQKQSDIQDQQIRQMYAATAGDRARLPSFFVSDAAVVSFIETMENLGPGAGSSVTISGVSADDIGTLKSGTFGSVTAHIEVSGTWAAVMRTLMLSEVLPYRSSVSRVNASMSGSGDAKNPQHIWHMTYDISADVMADSSSTPLKK